MCEYRKPFITKCQKFLDYLWSIREDPILMTVRQMDFSIEVQNKRDRSLYPIPDTKYRMLRYLDEVGAIEWDRSKKFQPIIRLKKRQL